MDSHLVSVDPAAAHSLLAQSAHTELHCTRPAFGGRAFRDMMPSVRRVGVLANAKDPVFAMIVQGSLVIKLLADMAIKYRLPAASSTRAFADVGGLMSFGADGPAAVRHGTTLVQKIFQGKHHFCGAWT